MPKPMFGYLWADGKLRDTPEPKPEYTSVGARPQPKPRREWKRRGFFLRDKPMPRHEVATRANNARMWLEYVLHNGPKPATEVLRLAKLEGVSVKGLRRAKKHHGIRSKKVGGRRQGWGARWMWHFPEPVSN